LAEPLKHQFGADIPRKIAAMVFAVSPVFPTEAFIKDALDGYDELDLMPRGWKIADALYRHLPSNYETAIAILINSLGPTLAQTQASGMAPFLYMPHGFFVAKYGIDHFEASMQAQYELTQRFTAEFSIRPFLERYPAATLARLQEWVSDPNLHVRRLVSEGTRPRLPWASRLREFQQDPRPVLALLEQLKDDPELYVRRSVANNLNDIGKDHPTLLMETVRRWMIDATDERRWLVRHALRSAIKRADPDALAILGFGKQANVTLNQVKIVPERPTIGESVAIAFEVRSIDSQPQRVLIDLRVHFVKANGKTSPKVFKLKTVDLAPQASVKLEKRLSLAHMTTRKHYCGIHQVDVLFNGSTQPLGSFELI